MVRDPGAGRLVYLAAVLAAAASACHCGGAGTAESQQVSNGEEGPAVMSERPAERPRIDPFTGDPPPPLPALRREEVEPAAITLSDRSALGRLGEGAVVLARDRAAGSTTWAVLDGAGRWGAPAKLPITSPAAVVECGGRAVVLGSRGMEFAVLEVSDAGEVERELPVAFDVGRPLFVPIPVCTEEGPVFVWRAKLEQGEALVVTSASTRALFDLGNPSGSLAAVAAKGRVMVLRTYSEVPTFSDKLELLAIEGDTIAGRVDVGDEPGASEGALFARDGYFLALWRQRSDHSIRAQVIAGDLSRTGPVQVLHRAEQLRRLRVVESPEGSIAAVWEELTPTGVASATGQELPEQGFRAALVDPLGRRLGPQTAVLPGADQYVRVSFAGESLVLVGGGRNASIERHRPAGEADGAGGQPDR